MYGIFETIIELSLEFIFSPLGASVFGSAIGMVGVGYLSLKFSNRTIRKILNWSFKKDFSQSTAKLLFNVYTRSSAKLNEEEEAKLMADFELCRELIKLENAVYNQLESDLEHFHTLVINKIKDGEKGVSKSELMARIIKKLGESPNT